ncbi:cell adhesion molecule DSCAML1-like isoform X2 [Montipora capricornis]|uniref:cell adhesion molecule DSCAML1-like isoform X2 n=1 Tax=Montipora capricornis TaxID=246305 RepID=UPI0035F18E7F
MRSHSRPPMRTGTPRRSLSTLVWVLWPVTAGMRTSLITRSSGSNNSAISENIVARKSTTQSSIYSDDYSNGTSDKAVDGNPDQGFKNGHCSRTLEDDPSWWRVDLSSPVQVFEVRIVIGNSPSSDGSNVTRNQVYNITLGDSFNVTNNPVCARWDGSFDLEASLVCYINPPRSGRYVGILTTRRQFLQLCEVEIFLKGNLAFRKPAIATGLVSGGDRTVDGNLGTAMKLLWWQVDLGKMVPVNEVIFYCDTPYFHYSVVVRLASSSSEEGQECRGLVEDRYYTRIRRFRTLCWPSVLGRHVTLNSVYGSIDVTAVYEVEVYSAQRGCQIQAISLFISGRAPDGVFSASSSRVNNGPENCRLNGNGAWLPSTKRNASDFLQINLGYEFYICATATQGKPTVDQWTTKYKIYTSLNNINWTTYKENGTEKVFHGNTGRNDTVKHNLEEVIIASFVRFQPTDFFGHKALRVELYGALKSLVPVEAPILVNLTAQSSTSVAASWKLSKRYYNEKKLISFKLLYQKEGSNVSEIQTINDAKNVRTENGLLVYSSEVTGLEKFTEYEFEVCVFSSVGNGPKSPLKIARTLEDVPSKAPSNFTVTANTSTVIIASWKPPSPDSTHGIIRGFKIFFRKKGSDNRPETIFVSNASMHIIPVTGLAKFTEYEFHVLAFTSAGDGRNSSVQFSKTKEDIPSKAPSGFMVKASNSTSITASWQLPPADSRNGIITGFKLFYRQKRPDNQPKLLNIFNASIRAETVSELMKFTEYEFQLLAYTSVGDGPNSSVQLVKTMEDAPSKPPSGFIVNASTSSSVTAFWQLPPADSRNGIIRGFKLFIKRKETGDKPDVQLIDVSKPSVYTKTITGLQESTEYELQVLAYTSAGDGPKSFVHAKTKEAGFSMASILGFSMGGVSFLGFLLLVGFSCHKKRRKKRTAKCTQVPTTEEVHELDNLEVASVPYVSMEQDTSEV